MVRPTGEGTAGASPHRQGKGVDEKGSGPAAENRRKECGESGAEGAHPRVSAGRSDRSFGHSDAGLGGAGADFLQGHGGIDAVASALMQLCGRHFCLCPLSENSGRFGLPGPTHRQGSAERKADGDSGGIGGAGGHFDAVLRGHCALRCPALGNRPTDGSGGKSIPNRPGNRKGRGVPEGRKAFAGRSKEYGLRLHRRHRWKSKGCCGSDRRRYACLPVGKEQAHCRLSSVGCDRPAEKAELGFGGHCAHSGVCTDPSGAFAGRGTD